MNTRRLRAPAIACATALACVAGPLAQASDLLGVYVSAGAGTAQLRASVPAGPGSSAFTFSESSTGWRAAAGIRAISLLGAEVSYVDFGSPSAQLGNQRVGGRLDAKAAHAVLWLPIPLPLLDVHVKAGYARLGGTLSGALARELDDNAVAAGAGVQLKLGSLALRADYERFMVGGADPAFVSLNLVKFFL